MLYSAIALVCCQKSRLVCDPMTVYNTSLTLGKPSTTTGVTVYMRFVCQAGCAGQDAVGPDGLDTIRLTDLWTRAATCI